MPDIFDSYSHQRPDAKPIIYAYSDTRWPGYLKVGFTTRSIEDRMKEHYPTLTPTTSYKVEYIESALYPDGTTFMDYAVHDVLKRKGIKVIKDSEDKKKTEWYECTVDDVKAAIIAVKTHTLNEENRTATFGMRPEQSTAVRLTQKYFEEEKKQSPNRTAKYLWNCKMRFGKTFASYQLAKRMGLNRVLILTFKPAVEDSWETDLMTHVDFEGWQFYSRKTEMLNGITPDELDQKKPIVCFGSFQDYLGTNDVGGIKHKNEWVHTTNWDLVIFDEYHFGAWRENAKKLFDTEDEDSYDSLDIEKYKKEEADNAYNESFLPITTKYYLYLSGTPFRALNTGEFLENQIYSWTYSDEQNAKANWEAKSNNANNPYLELPRMVMMTYKLPDEIENVAKNSDLDEFDLNIFFSAKHDGDVEKSEFVYKNYVQKWLDLIRGQYLPSSIDELRINKGDRPVMPFSDVRMLNILTHTLWFLPNVASCYAMRNLLAEKQNTFYHDYTVNLCAGTKAGIGLDAVAPVRDSMSPALDTKTITLSCGKLTTGITIRPWTGIFMLRNLSSPETYFQAAFRVQSPWKITRDDGTEEIIKEDCYIFDFAVNRALRQVADYSTRLNIHESNPETKVANFIRFLPVLAFDGSAMLPISASNILDIVTAGTSANLLARRWESALLVNVDNDTLSRILANQDALDALMSIEGFRSLNKDIETIINRSEHVKKVKREHDDGKPLTKKEKEELSKEEKEYKSKRKEVQEKLIKFATRIPIFMYLTDYREYSLKDIITRLEPGLFKKVTGLSVKDFELLVSLGVFNDALMNDAIFKFKRYEDNSLEYTGLTKHSADENVGLFNTVITRQDYEQLARLQGESLVVDDEPPIPVLNITSKSTSKVGVISTKQVEQAAMVADGTGTYNESKPNFKVDKSKIKVGATVEHKTFGKGKIISIDGGYLEVAFDEKGQKKFQTPDAFEKGFLKI